jgi:hypothetical protein
MRNIFMAIALTCLTASAMAQVPETGVWKSKAETAPTTLAELVLVTELPTTDQIMLDTQFVVVPDPFAEPPRKPGLFGKALLGSLSIVAPKAVKAAKNAPPPRPRNTSYLVAMIDRSTRAVTYRIHHPRTTTSLQSLIPEFKIKFGTSEESSTDTKGWRSSGSCTQGYWIRNTAFGTQSYIPPVCTYSQRYDFAVSPALIEKAAAHHEKDISALLTAGFMAVSGKAKEPFLSEVASFFPSEIKALQLKVTEQLTKLDAPASNQPDAAAPLVTPVTDAPKTP